MVQVDWDYDMTPANMQFIGVFDTEDGASEWQGKKGVAVFKSYINDDDTRMHGSWAKGEAWRTGDECHCDRCL